MSATISFSYFSVSSLLRHIIVHAQQVDLILIKESRKIIDPSTNKKPQKKLYINNEPIHKVLVSLTLELHYGTLPDAVGVLALGGHEKY